MSYLKPLISRWDTFLESSLLSIGLLLDAMYKIGKDKLLLWADARITAVDVATVVG